MTTLLDTESYTNGHNLFHFGVYESLLSLSELESKIQTYAEFQSGNSIKFNSVTIGGSSAITYEYVSPGGEGIFCLENNTLVPLKKATVSVIFTKCGDIDGDIPAFTNNEQAVIKSILGSFIINNPS